MEQASSRILVGLVPAESQWELWKPFSLIKEQKGTSWLSRARTGGGRGSHGGGGQWARFSSLGRGGGRVLISVGAGVQCSHEASTAEQLTLQASVLHHNCRAPSLS